MWGSHAGDGGLVALELLDHLAHPVVAPHLRAGRDVLPAQQEPHEVLGGDRLDRLAPGLARVRVHAGQQPPGAPLDRSSPGAASRTGEGALQREAVVLEHGQADGDQRRRQAAPLGQRRGGERAGDRRGGRAARRPPPARGGGRRRARRAPPPPPGPPARWPTTARTRAAPGRRASPGWPACAAPGPARPAASNRGRHSSRAGVTTRLQSRSCSSSAVRGAGATSSTHPGDGLGVEPADGRQVDRQAAAQRHGVGAPVLRLGVVEEGVGLGGQDLVAEGRRLGGVAEVHLHPARSRCRRAASVRPSMSRPSVSVSCMVWRTIGWSGIWMGPVTFSWQAAACGEQGRHHVVGLHALDRRRVAATALEPQHDEGPVEVPAPAALEHRRRRRQHRLLQHLAHRARS